MAERIRGPRAIVGIRRRTVEVSSAAWEVEYRRYFSGLARRYMAAHPSGKAAPVGVFHVKQSGFWSSEKERLRDLLNKQYAAMTETVWTNVVSTQVGRRLDFDLNARGVERILGRVATRVTQINDASQQMIATRVASEINAGSNADRLESSVRSLLQGWGESGGRAHIIALTESGNAYNLAATEGYRESGLVERVQVYDGPECGWTEHDDPDLADGSTRTLEEAEEYPLSHPHCQRAFGPVVLTEEEAQGQDLQPGESVTPEDLPAAEEPAPVEPEEPKLTQEEQIQIQGERIRTIEDHEVGIAVDRDGNVILDKLGQGQDARSYGGVDFTDAELALMRGETLIHNHPGGYIEGWAHSGAFSPQDILLAHEYGIGEMRVVGKGVDYAASTANVPPSVGSFTLRKAIEKADTIVRAANEEMIRVEKALAREAAKRPDGSFDVMAYGRAEKDIYARASMDHYHKVWEEVARAIPGFRYSRTLHGRG